MSTSEFRLSFAPPLYGAQPSISLQRLAEEVYARDFCLLRRLDRPDPHFHRRSSFGHPDESLGLEVLMSRRAMWQRPRRGGCNPHRDFSSMRALHPLRSAIAGLQSFEAALQAPYPLRELRPREHLDRLHTGKHERLKSVKPHVAILVGTTRPPPIELRLFPVGSLPYTALEKRFLG